MVHCVLVCFHVFVRFSFVQFNISLSIVCLFRSCVFLCHCFMCFMGLVAWNKIDDNICLRAANDREDCPRLTYYHIRNSVARWWNEPNDTTYNRILDNIADRDATVAGDLKAEYTRAASNSMSRDFELFFDDWRVILVAYPDTGRLTACLQDQAEMRSHWARTFLGNAPLIAESAAAWVSTLNLQAYI